MAQWITVVRNLGSGQIEVWFDGWPGRGGSTQWSQVDWDYFFRHVIQKHGFKQFADYYIWTKRAAGRLKDLEAIAEIEVTWEEQQDGDRWPPASPAPGAFAA